MGVVIGFGFIWGVRCLNEVVLIFVVIKVVSGEDEIFFEYLFLKCYSNFI